MSIKDAIKILSAVPRFSPELRSEAVKQIASELITSWSQADLFDWIYNGSYQSTDTLKMIQKDLYEAQDIAQEELDAVHERELKSVRYSE